MSRRGKGPGLVMAAIGLIALPCASWAAVRVVGGPTVLHSGIYLQWGGHTFSYALQGQRYLFWSAISGKADLGKDGKELYRTTLVGQYPLPGGDGVPAVHAFTFSEPDFDGAAQPLIFRTPDGYLHAIIGVYHKPVDGARAGTLRYYRSARPEDVTEWVDRTELIPTKPYGDFHLRMNVAVTPDGKRAVIAILAVSTDGSVPWNTPLIFVGKREGRDFRFAAPIRYTEPFSFFYPQIAALNDGIVIVGENWEDQWARDHAGQYSRVTARLIHLDWQGKVLHQEDLPAGEGKGSWCAYDMRPEKPGAWGSLIIAHSSAPDGGQAMHRFLRYDVAARRLTVVREMPVPYGYVNPGKWLPIAERHSVFLNNPSLGQVNAWEGDVLGEGELRARRLARTNPIELGYQGQEYLMTPNPLLGSVLTAGEAYLMCDTYNPEKQASRPAPLSLLLWRLELGGPR
jgi:hypothetical protein